MKVTVVSGLLGSGKTTFIKNAVCDTKQRTVVLVNDFGAAGIDGEIFSAGGIDAVELPSGCVCCTLKVDLITTVQRIVKQFSPEHLVIEPSGVASPSGVLEALESAGVGEASVIGIVDASEFKELYESGMYGGFFEDQVRNADIVLVNKTDLANERLVKETEQMVGAINPRAILFRTINAGIKLPQLQAPQQREIVHSSSHVQFETRSFKLAQGTDMTLVQNLFDDLARGKFGRIARAKALVSTSAGPYRFDLTFGRVDRIRFEKEIMDSRMVVIGEGLDSEGIRFALQHGLR